MTRPAPEWLEQFLAGRWLCHLATVRRDGTPQVTPVWYLWRDSRFYMIAGAHAAKVRNIRRNPHVSLAVASEKPPYYRVMAEGRASILVEGTRKMIRELSVRYLGEKLGEAYARILGKDEMVTIVVEAARLIAQEPDEG